MSRGRNARESTPGWHRHLELVATVLLAVATVTTAWSAFQSGKWGGYSAASYSAATADRTLSNRSATLAGQQTIIDVTLFTDWLAAVNEEQGQVLPPSYVPDPTTYSGFLYERFRPEFRPALHAWLAEDPATNPEAPPSPFAMDEYVLAAAQESQRLESSADAAATIAHAANQREGQLRARDGDVCLGAVLLRDRCKLSSVRAARR